MKINVIDLEGNKTELSFKENDEVSLRAVRFMLTTEKKYDLNRIIFCSSGVQLQDDSRLTKEFFKGDPTIVLFDTSIYSEKSYPRVDNAFQFGNPRYTDYTVKQESVFSGGNDRSERASSFFRRWVAGPPSRLSENSLLDLFDLIQSYPGGAENLRDISNDSTGNINIILNGREFGTAANGAGIGHNSDDYSDYSEEIHPFDDAYEGPEEEEEEEAPHEDFVVDESDSIFQLISGMRARPQGAINPFRVSRLMVGQEGNLFGTLPIRNNNDDDNNEPNEGNENNNDTDEPPENNDEIRRMTLLEREQSHQGGWARLRDIAAGGGGQGDALPPQIAQFMPATEEGMDLGLTQADREAIGRLAAAGFDHMTCIQVYDACDRNEAAAMSCLIGLE